jgi:hypothetical protein
VEGVVSSEWGLFVDESGKFRDPDDCVVGAGILIRLDVPMLSARAIERALDKATPDFPWPLHAAHIRLGVTAPIARAARLRYMPPADRAARPPDPFDAIATGVLTRLERVDAPRVQQTLDKLRQGVRPDLDDLKPLDERLRSIDPVLHRKLEDYGRKTIAWVLLLISRLAQSGDLHRLVATVLSGESAPGDAIPEGAEGARADAARYLTLLQCLIGRTCDVLSRLPGSHEVAVHVANRPIADPARGRVQFDLAHLREAIRQATPPGLTSVRLHAASTPDFDASVDGRIILADFVANQARHRLKESYPLRALEAQLAAVTVGPVHSGEPPLSHVAASGWAREHIEAARHAGAAQPAPLGTKRWAQDQATQWAKALRPRH